MAAYSPYDGGPDGLTFPTDTSKKLSFYGGTVTSRQSAAALSASLSIFAVTGASMLAASTATLTGLVTFTTTQYTTIVDAIAELRSLVATLNLHKGGA